MASNSAKVDQSTPTFNSGEMVLADFEGKKFYKIAVICPDFGSNDEYTKVALFGKQGLARFYHVQMINGQSAHEEYWLPEGQLKALCDDMKQFLKSSCFWPIAKVGKSDLEYIRKILEKTPKERLEICKMRAESYDCFKISTFHLNAATKMEIWVLQNGDVGFKFQLKNETQIEQEINNNENQDDARKLQEENEQLKNELKSLKESYNALQNAGNDDQNAFCLEQQMEKMNLEDQSDEIQRLKEKIAYLEKTKTELYNRYDRLFRETENEQSQNEKMIDDLKHRNLMLSRERDDREKLRFAKDNLRRDNFLITEKNAKLTQEMQDKENLLFANEIVIEELKAKNLKLWKENSKLTKANEKCKCKK